MTLVEVTAASFLMAILAATLIEGLVSVQTQRSELSRRQIARFEAANQLQRIAALRWNQLIAVPNGPVPLSQTARQSLPSAQMTAHITVPPDDPDARRIAVELQWLGPSTGQPEAPIRLTAWAYQKARRERQ